MYKYIKSDIQGNLQSIQYLRVYIHTKYRELDMYVTEYIYIYIEQRQHLVFLLIVLHTQLYSYHVLYH